MPRELVTIAVPVYRGERFVAEALACLQQQTWSELEVIVSLDGPDEPSAAACAPFLSDARFRLVVRPARMGWAGHLSALMSEGDGAFSIYHQQDDLLAPDYVERLLELARAAPDAAVVYCDIQAFGTYHAVIRQPPVTGGPSLRELTLLHEHVAAVALRGLTRRAALRAAGGLRTNAEDSFAADTTWMASIARSGELLRLPETLYRKRYHDGNVHMKWFEWPRERRLRAWAIHCAAMTREALAADVSLRERRLLWLAGADRLSSRRTALAFVPVDELTGEEHELLTATFLAAAREPAPVVDASERLELDWAAIETCTRYFVGTSGAM